MSHTRPCEYLPDLLAPPANREHLHRLEVPDIKTKKVSNQIVVQVYKSNLMDALDFELLTMPPRVPWIPASPGAP